MCSQMVGTQSPVIQLSRPSQTQGLPLATVPNAIGHPAVSYERLPRANLGATPPTNPVALTSQQQINGNSRSFTAASFLASGEPSGSGKKRTVRNRPLRRNAPGGFRQGALPHSHLSRDVLSNSLHRTRPALRVSAKTSGNLCCGIASTLFRPTQQPESSRRCR